MFDGLGITSIEIIPEPVQVRPTVAQVAQVICEATGLTLEELRLKDRHQRYSAPRQIAMYLARELTGKSLPQIGRALGGFDHTTVLYAHRKVAFALIKNPKVAEAVEQYRAAILALAAETPPAPTGNGQGVRRSPGLRPQSFKANGRRYYPYNAEKMDPSRWALREELEDA